YLLTLERRKRGVGIQQPGVSEPGGAPDAAVAVRREPDGRARVLERTHRDAHVAQAEVRAVVGDGLAAPEALDHLEPFDEPHGAREPHLLDVLAEPGGLWIVRQMLDREPDAELHSGSLHTRAGAGSSASVNWGSAMWSARSWKMTRTRRPIATFASASGVRSGFTRVPMIRS